MDEKEGEGEVGEVTVTSSRVYEVGSETEPYAPEDSSPTDIVSNPYHKYKSTRSKSHLPKRDNNKAFLKFSTYLPPSTSSLNRPLHCIYVCSVRPEM